MVFFSKFWLLSLVILENCLLLVKRKHHFLKDVIIESTTCAVKPLTSRLPGYLGRIHGINFENIISPERIINGDHFSNMTWMIIEMMNSIFRFSTGMMVYSISVLETLSHLTASALSNPWWRHEMETFSELLALCAGNSPVTGEFPSQRPVTQSFGVFFDLHLE